MSRKLFYLSLLLLTVIFFKNSARAQSPLGIFEGQNDVGNVKPKGTASYNPLTQQYTLTSSGANVWGTTDAFHFLWKKMKGDFILRANVKFMPRKGASEYRKVGVM